MTIITSDWGTYSAHGYTVSNNPWNKQTQVNGVDYTNTITFDLLTFPNNITFAWSWPSYDAGWVQAYPEIKYIPKDSLEIQLLRRLEILPASRQTILSAYLATRKTSNVARDLWLSGPNGTDEVMVWVHSPQYPMGSNQTYQLTDPPSQTQMYVIANVGLTYVAVQTPTDQLSGTTSLSDIFKTLIWKRCPNRR